MFDTFGVTSGTESEAEVASRGDSDSDGDGRGGVDPDRNGAESAWGGG